MCIRDSRGANAPRGREWRKCIYGEVGTFASEDQARGIQVIILLRRMME